MSRQNNSGFVLDPIAYFIALAGGAVFVLALIFVAGLVILPIAALALAGLLLFRRHQLRKLRVTITAPLPTGTSSFSAADPRPADDGGYEPFDLDEFAQEIDGTILRYVEKPTGRYSSKPLSDAFTAIATQLYGDESFNLPPAPPATSDLIALAKYQDQFDRWKQLREDPDTFKLFLDTVCAAYLTLRRYFPPFALQENTQSPASPLSAPAHISMDADEVTNFAAEFFVPQLKENHLFERLREQILTNGARLEGAREPVTFEGLFAETPFARFSDIELPFCLPEQTRFSGHWLIAPPGRGKTTALHALIKDDLEKDAAIVLIDSKGDLIDPLKDLAQLKDRLLLIEPDPDLAFALNPLDVGEANPMHAANMIEYIMAGLLDAKFTALQSTLFRNVIPAIIEGVPNPTLDTFKQVMVKGLPPEALDKLNPHAKDFFTNRDTGFNSKTYESTRKEVVWRLDYLMTNPVLRSMFSAAQTKLDMSREMDAGRVIIINNSKAILGDEGAEFFGRFFIALILRAAQQRAGKPAASKKPCYVYIDEAQSVIAKDTRIPTLIDECRSQKIALILAHQRTAQLTPPVLDAVANCAIRMANSDDEAKYLSSKLRMDTEVLQALPRGTFGTFVRDLTPQGIPVRIAKVDLDSLPRMSADEMAAIRHRMKTDFSAAPGAIGSAADRPSQRAPTPDGNSPDTPAATTPSNEPAPTPDPGEPAARW